MFTRLAALESQVVTYLFATIPGSVQGSINAKELKRSLLASVTSTAGVALLTAILTGLTANAPAIFASTGLASIATLILTVASTLVSRLGQGKPPLTSEQFTQELMLRSMGAGALTANDCRPVAMMTDEPAHLTCAKINAPENLPGVGEIALLLELLYGKNENGRIPGICDPAECGRIYRQFLTGFDEAKQDPIKPSAIEPDQVADVKPDQVAAEIPAALPPTTDQPQG